ncbi:hypothetical protein TUMSATVNIG1_36330 [Vibrio nigripulchritudo]|nr:hypothetical protein VNTUMSATTG_36040 [Vibrio nigripulchritudo]BDU33024.1 hypothetical protein TUMSATVNIG1_36330 [Vibrio nigripulchritudo]
MSERRVLLVLLGASSVAKDSGDSSVSNRVNRVRYELLLIGYALGRCALKALVIDVLLDIPNEGLKPVKEKTKKWIKIILSINSTD